MERKQGEERSGKKKRKKEKEGTLVVTRWIPLINVLCSIYFISNTFAVSFPRNNWDLR